MNDIERQLEEWGDRVRSTTTRPHFDATMLIEPSARLRFSRSLASAAGAFAVIVLIGLAVGRHVLDPGIAGVGSPTGPSTGTPLGPHASPESSRTHPTREQMIASVCTLDRPTAKEATLRATTSATISAEDGLPGVTVEAYLYLNSTYVVSCLVAMDSSGEVWSGFGGVSPASPLEGAISLDDAPEGDPGSFGYGYGVGRIRNEVVRVEVVLDDGSRIDAKPGNGGFVVLTPGGSRAIVAIAYNADNAVIGTATSNPSEAPAVSPAQPGASFVPASFQELVAVGCIAGRGIGIPDANVALQTTVRSMTLMILRFGDSLATCEINNSPGGHVGASSAEGLSPRSAVLSADLTSNQYEGHAYGIDAGRVDPLVKRVEVVLDDGSTVEAFVQNGYYIAFWEGTGVADHAIAFDGRNNIVFPPPTALP